MADADFERAFGSLAYAELEQKAPGLFPYLIGFQLAHKSDDETHAVGIFGFKVGEQWYYCPVFWLNGKIKGYDLLYIVSQDMFIPMEESWINYLTNRQPYILGTPGSDKQDFTSPDLSPYTQSPISKQSSINEDNWGDPSAMHVSPLDSRYTKSASALSLNNALKHPALAASLLRTMNENTKFAEAVYSFYSPGDVLEIARGAKQAAFSKIAADNFVSGNNVKVRVQYGKAVSGPANMTNLSAKQRETVLRGDAVIDDNRKPEDVAKIYAKPDFARTLSSPNRSGIWSVLYKGMEFKNSLVIIGPQTPGKSDGSGIATVIELDNKKFVNAPVKAVFARQQIDPAGWDTMFAKFSTVQDVKVDDIGLLIAKNFSGTVPFRVTRIIKSKEGLTSWCVTPYDRTTRTDTSIFGGTSGGNCLSDSISYKYDTYDARCPELESSDSKKSHRECNGHHIVISPKASGFCAFNDALTVNKDEVRFIKIGKFEYKTVGTGSEACVVPSSDDYERKRGDIALGSPSDVDSYLFKVGMHDISAKPDIDDFISVNFRGRMHRRLSKNAALKLFMEDIGLSQDDSMELIKSARVATTNGLVKLALPMPSRGGYDDQYGAVTTSPASDTLNLGDGTSPEAEDPAEPMRPDIAQQAEQAASKGQKEVFDLSVLSGLINAVEIDEPVDGMLKDLIVGNDRVGRLLFLYYWHFDKFAEKYGDDDMRELEDTLRNVFKTTGTLILFLKRKSIEPGSVERASVDISGAPAASWL